MKSYLLWFLLVTMTHPSFGQINKPTLISNIDFDQVVAKNARFPAAAQRLGKSVRVHVGFTLTDNGNYQDVSIINHEPIHESLKQEVDRLWHILPSQDPKYAGNYIMPIAFMLGEGEPDNLKPISNPGDKFATPVNYTLLREVSVIGYLVCEKKSLSNQ